MVRLKVTVYNDERKAQIRFQFHNGSIKSGVGLSSFQRWCTFQFHNGSIKSSVAYSLYHADEPFQFHNGSIKSGTHLRETGLDSRFNSTMVRLKGV